MKPEISSTDLGCTVRTPVRVNRPRNITIDVAKAFAIVLVVIGHFYPAVVPCSYGLLHDIIYMFHMPLFMFASGYIYISYGRKPDSIKTYKAFIIKKFKRLMIPYFATSVIVITIKLAMSGVLKVDNPVSATDYINILYLPSAGYFLWFIWALWWMMVLIPLFDTPSKRLILLLLSVPAYYMCDNFTEILCIRQLCGNLIYFNLGVCAADFIRASRPVLNSIKLKIGLIALFIVLVSLYVTLITPSTHFEAAVSAFILAIAGIGMSMSLSSLFVRFAYGRIHRIALSIASASYIIYLFHTTFEGFAKAILDKLHFFASGSSLQFYAGAVIVVGCGVIIPWVLAIYVLPKYRLTRTLFGL